MRFGQPSYYINGALDAARAPIQDLGIDHRGAHIVMTEEFLDRSDVITIFQQMCGEGMSQRVASRPFC